MARFVGWSTRARFAAKKEERAVREYAVEYCSSRPRMAMSMVISAINAIGYSSDIPTYAILDRILDQHFADRGEGWFAEQAIATQREDK